MRYGRPSYDMHNYDPAMTRRRALLVVLALLLLAAVGGYWWQRPLLLTATGYAAHNACAVENISGRSNSEADLPSNPLVPLLRIDREEKETTASLLGVLSRQKAIYIRGYGCTLADEAPDAPTPGDIDEADNPFAATPEPDLDPAVADVLAYAFGDDLADAEQQALGTRGVLVVKDGEIVAERYGDGFDAATPQLGWSMAKSATNLIAGRLAYDELISLEDSALRSEWTDERSAISIEDLMTMTSGLTWDETYDLGTPITAMLYLEPEMADFVAAQPMAHLPSTHLQYSSGSTNLLCDALSERSGIPGPSLHHELLFAPLGLSNAVMEIDGAGSPVCSSYLWATPREWAAIGQFALQNGEWNGQQLLPTDWMSRSTTAVAAQGEQRGYAAGWWANLQADGTLRYPSLPDDAYFAKGHDSQWVAVVPSADLVVVRLGFTPDADDDRVVTTIERLLATG